MRKIRIDIERIKLVFSWTIRVMLVIAMLSAIPSANWMVLFVSFLNLVLTYLPWMIERNYKVDIPAEFEIAIILFLFSSIFLGEARDFYNLIWWWDLMLHGFAAIALAFAAFVILFALYERDKIQAKPITIAIFTFLSALGVGALWEIFEFSMDQFFGMNMQKSGLMDTMWDLILDALGALLVANFGLVYLKGKRTHFFNFLLKRTIALNRGIFTRVKRNI